MVGVRFLPLGKKLYFCSASLYSEEKWILVHYTVKELTPTCFSILPGFAAVVMTCFRFGQDQICTQLNATRFSPFGPPKSLNAFFCCFLKILNRSARSSIELAFNNLRALASKLSESVANSTCDRLRTVWPGFGLAKQHLPDSISNIRRRQLCD